MTKSNTPLTGEDVQEKAKELVNKFKRATCYWKESVGRFGVGKRTLEQNPNAAKQCAIIHADEIINDYKMFFATHYSTTIDFDITHAYSDRIKFYQQVKEAINKI